MNEEEKQIMNKMIYCNLITGEQALKFNAHINNLQEELRQTKMLKEKYQTQKEVYKSTIDKAIEYIETIKDNTPSSTRKDFAKMVLVNYETLLDILRGSDK